MCVSAKMWCVYVCVCASVCMWLRTYVDTRTPNVHVGAMQKGKMVVDHYPLLSGCGNDELALGAAQVPKHSRQEKTEARPVLDYWPAYLAPDPAPIRPRIRAPAGSGRLCDGRTAAPNLQRRQWGASVAATRTRAQPTAASLTYTRGCCCCCCLCCFAAVWREPLGEDREEGCFAGIDRVSVHLLACSCSRPGDAVTFDDPRIRTRTKHTHADTHAPYTGTHRHTHTHTRHAQTWWTGCDMMEPPPMPNSIADAILWASRGRGGAGGRWRHRVLS